MFVGPIGRLSANNAAFTSLNLMNSVNALIGSASFGGNTNQLRKSELGLTLGMLNNSLNYKAGMLHEDSMKKISDANIKRTFSTFA